MGGPVLLGKKVNSKKDEMLHQMQMATVGIPFFSLNAYSFNNMFNVKILSMATNF